MSHAVTSDHLTVSRINRLLRPLRVKCAALAASELHPEIPTPIRPRQWRDEDMPPLAIIPPPKPPGSLRGRGSEASSRREYELAQKTYAVRDCFRNLVAAVLGNGRNQVEENSLAALCAKVVGITIEEEVQDAADDTEMDKFVEDDDVALEITGNLYEAVPQHHRRYVRERAF